MKWPLYTVISHFTIYFTEIIYKWQNMIKIGINFLYDTRYTYISSFAAVGGGKYHAII